MQDTDTRTWRQKVDALGDEHTAAIMSAVQNIEELGYDEADDSFWAEVYGQVMA